MRYDHMIDYLRELITDHNDPRAFSVMSDEELAAIDRAEYSEFTVQPWIDAQSDLDATVAVRFGERSLLLRGLLVPEDVDEDGETILGVSDDLRMTADARRLGAGFIRATSTVEDVRTARVMVLQAELGGFEEDITADGFHLFAGCTYATASARLAGWALPIADQGQVRGTDRIHPDAWGVRAVEELGVDLRVVDLMLFLPGPDGELQEETWAIAHNDTSAVLAEPLDQAANELRLSYVTPSMLATRLSGRIGSALPL